MQIVVLANDVVFKTIKETNPAVNWVNVADVDSFSAYPDADAFFDLTENAAVNDHPVNGKPLFINSVTAGLPVGKKATRINGWNGFLQHTTWEVAGHVSEKEKEILAALNKTIIECADEPGFIAARIIAMIINEAYFAKGENVSTEAEIDIAMKLGTNYPYGPFEWAEKIGIQQVYELLLQLAKQDARYQPSPSLTQKATG